MHHAAGVDDVMRRQHRAIFENMGVPGLMRASLDLTDHADFRAVDDALDAREIGAGPDRRPRSSVRDETVLKNRHGVQQTRAQSRIDRGESLYRAAVVDIGVKLRHATPAA